MERVCNAIVQGSFRLSYFLNCLGDFNSIRAVFPHNGWQPRNDRRKREEEKIVRKRAKMDVKIIDKWEIWNLIE